MPVEPVPTVVALSGSPEATSFALLVALVIVLAVTLFSVLSALLDMILYTGAAALAIGLVFRFSGSLSLDAGLQYVFSLIGLG